MKPFLISFLFLLTALIAVAQPVEEVLQAEGLSDLRGEQLIREALQRAEQRATEGSFPRAERLGRLAYREAERLQLFVAMARSRYWQARGILGQGDLSESREKEAEDALEESRKLLDGGSAYNLRLDNLLLLQEVALRRGRKLKHRRLGKDIAALRFEMQKAGVDDAVGQGASPASLGSRLPRSRRSMSQELSELSEENEALGRQLQEQEARLDTLSREQMKRQLMLAEQQVLLDKLAHEREIDSIVLGQQELELSERNAQLDLQKTRTNMWLAIAGVALVVLLALLFRFFSIRQYNKLLEQKNEMILEEKKRSEELLLNILPGAIAEELKSRGMARAREYPMVSVLFVDFQAFSKIIKKFSPAELVEELNYCFSHFDQIVEKHRLEKIKTIGDAYMCAGGLPQPDPRHPARMIRAALEIQEFLIRRKHERETKNQPFFEGRLGIHTGPVIAGVVGLKKFTYDIWGDTVNVASRMESSSEPGRINISGATWELIREEFPCTYRGRIEAKNVGELDMYYVN